MNVIESSHRYSINFPLGSFSIATSDGKIQTIHFHLNHPITLTLPISISPLEVAAINLINEVAKLSQIK